MAIILGIETSCDETAAAVYSTDKRLCSSELFSQIELHKNYGGVVPEVASRSHLEKITFITSQALEKAAIPLETIDAVAVTNKPGLPGSLLVGLCFAKACAWASNKKLIGVNHLEGHIFSPYIEHNVPFPHICLAASGGHTSLYYVTGFGAFDCIGMTLDDAAGEAFDKIAKLINVSYPGGPLIESMAREVGFYDFFKYPRAHGDNLNFSFSGLKTAVMYDLIKRDAYDMKTKTFTDSSNQKLQHKVASSLVVCMADIFSMQVQRALNLYPQTQALTFVGGVACNKYIKSVLQNICTSNKISFIAPSPAYCTDNAAMIAFVGHYNYYYGNFSDLTLDIV